jgi:Ca2+-binding RTX toxin-like protein
MRRNRLWWTFPCALLILLGVAASQSSHSNRSLSINGHTGNVTVYQIDGRTYVDLESLVRTANGSMSFKGDQITLTFPAANGDSTASDGRGSADTNLTAQFMNESVKTLSVLKDWTSTLSYGVQRGVPGDGSRLVVFHNRGSEALHLATVAATSGSDQDALQLLKNQFNTLSAWSDKLVGERKNMDTGKYSVSADALKNDDTYQKITACAKFLSKMLPSGTYQDDYSCH